MVAGRREDGDGGVDPCRGAEPLAPLGIAVGAVDEIAGVEGEGRAGRIAKRLAEDARPMGFDVVLGVAKIDEGEGRGLAFGGAEVKPLGPVGTVADPVSVKRIGSKGGKLDGVEVDLTEIGGEIGGAGRVVGGLELGVVGGGGELGETALDAGGGAPSDGLGGRGIAGPGEHDAVGQRCGRVGEFLRVGRGLPRVGGGIVGERGGGEEGESGATGEVHRE